MSGSSFDLQRAVVSSERGGYNAVYHCDPNATRPERIDYWGEGHGKAEGVSRTSRLLVSATRFNPSRRRGCETMHALRLQRPA